MSNMPVSPVRGRRRDQRGFTLIELLAAVAIIATVMVPVTAWALLVDEAADGITGPEHHLDVVGPVADLSHRRCGVVDDADRTR